MHNLNAFFKLKARELKLSNQDIADYIGFSKSYVSRLFNRSIEIKDQRILRSLCQFMNINLQTITNKNNEFEKLFHQYMKAVYFIDNAKHDLYQKIIAYKEALYNTPYYIDFLFIDLVHLSYVTNYRKPGYETPLEKLLYCESALTNDEKKLLYTFYFAILRHKRAITDAEQVFDKALAIVSDDKDAEMLLYDLGFSFPWANNRIKRDIECYYRCKSYAEATNNIERLINLDIKYAIFLGNNGDIQSELDCYLDLLNTNKVTKTHRNYKVVLNNIAYAYMSLYQYKKALPYLIKVLEYVEDNDLYFSIAWCYYKLGLTKPSTKYIEKGLNSFNHLDFNFDLLNWLKAMINKKYSEKSFRILNEILEKYQGNIDNDRLQFIMMEIANYYHYHGMEREAYLQSIEIANKNVICITKMHDVF